MSRHNMSGLLFKTANGKTLWKPISSWNKKHRTNDMKSWQCKSNATIHYLKLQMVLTSKNHTRLTANIPATLHGKYNKI